MASIEAVESLISGGEAWREYVRGRDATIDLSFADLQGRDLRGRQFVNCDLTGTIFKGANLDESTFEDCSLKSANATNASLIKCKFSSVDATAMALSETVIRKSIFTDTNFTHVNALSADVQASHFIDCRMEGLVLDHATFRGIQFDRAVFTSLACSEILVADCRFFQCQLTRWSLTQGTITNSSFRKCELEDWALHAGVIEGTAMVECTIRRLGSETVVVARLDLTGSTVVEVDLDAVGPRSAILLNTAFVSCSWPRQTGRVSWSGVYTPSASLVSHPVQDMRAVPPIIRREIADAQYLVSKLADAKGIQSYIYRLWGATSGYGQSLIRLSISSVVIVILHTLGLLAARNQLFGLHPDLLLLVRQLGTMSMTFLGVAPPSAGGEADLWESAVIVSLRIFGFLGLGIWVTIAATKVGRLAGQ